MTELLMKQKLPLKKKITKKYNTLNKTMDSNGRSS